MLTSFDINYVQKYRISDHHEYSKFVLLDLRVKNLQETRFELSLNGSVEISILRGKDVYVPIIFLAGRKIKLLFVIDGVSDKF